jgi:hypothetical protein
MKNFAENGATDKELADAKTYITGSFPLAFLSNVEIANQMNSFQRVGLPIDYIAKRNGLINAVTLNDVHRVARRLFTSDKLTIVIAGTLQGAAVAAKPIGAGKPPAPAQPPPKPLSPKTGVPGPKPPVATTTAAKPKEQTHTPVGAAPGNSPHP